MKIGNNGHLVLGPFDESTPCLMMVWMNCQTKLRINHLTAVKSVAILEKGSAEDAIKNAGAGAYSSAFSIRYPVGKYYDTIDGEIAAISFAIDKLKSCSEGNIVFFINSPAAILSLINSKCNE
ncbi:alpha-2 adrenergic receptor [Trichonephila clavipes]|nr:alpha-2 adrenergic receptor [Trichonephila clavipes]